MQAIVISPDPDERDLLVYTLRKAGLAVAASAEYRRVLSNWTDHAADVMLVALAADADPVQVIGEVRAITQVPLVLMAEPMSEADTCKVLNMGADVVINRPASPLVVAAQCSVILRRSNAVPGFVLPSLDLGLISLDPSSRQVEVQGKPSQRLTQLEFRLLYVLMTNRGQVLPSEVIVERVWGYSGEGNRDLVRGLVSRLRHKIEPDPEKPIFLETLSGVGYRFNSDDT
jgi:DNA-binding response OmpR family regulator